MIRACRTDFPKARALELLCAVVCTTAALAFSSGCSRVAGSADPVLRYSLSFQDPGVACASGTCGIQAAESASIEVPAAIALDPRDVGAARVTAGGQRIAIRLTERGFHPAVVVLQRGLPAELEIRTRADVPGLRVVVPVYAASVRLQGAATVLEVVPGFDFTAGLEGRPERFYVRVLDRVDRRSAREAAGVVERYLELARQLP